MLHIYRTMEVVHHPKRKDILFEQVLKALSDPVRLSVVRQLMKVPGGEKACGTFDYAVTKATFSHHIKILIDAGVIHKRQESTRSMISLRSEDINKKFPGLLVVVASAK